MQVTTTYYR